MQTTKHTFPALQIEALPNGLLRLEDPTFESSIVDIHPVHVQVMAGMIGHPMPDNLHAIVSKLKRRLAALQSKAHELAGLLRAALQDGENIACELTHAESLDERLAEIAEDFAGFVDTQPGPPASLGESDPQGDAALGQAQLSMPL